MRNNSLLWTGLALAFVAALIAPTAFCDPADFSLHVDGAQTPDSNWTAAQLESKFVGEITPIQYASHGKTHTFKCVPLITLLKAAGAPAEFKMQPKADPKVKSYALRFAVVAHGRDGYVAAFSMAELLPDIGNRHVWVALEEDDQPLSADEGPIRLISPDDQKPARSVHQLAEITVVDTSTSTRPSGG
jgi:hypothetical protein